MSYTDAGTLDGVDSAAVTDILSPMAKVTISLPDDLLARIDAQAKERHSTRSATLRELAEVALGERRRQLSERMAGLEGGARGHGGGVADQVKAGRPA